jgi:hypothetical protein
MSVPWLWLDCQLLESEVLRKGSSGSINIVIFHSLKEFVSDDK